MTVHADPESVDICLVLHELPPTPVLKQLRRLLGLGFAEIGNRVDAGLPLTRTALFRNDHLAVADRLLELVGLLAPFRHEVHECVGGEQPGASTLIDAATLGRILTDPGVE